MNLLRKSVDLQQEMLQARHKALPEQDLMLEVFAILEENQKRRDEILAEINSGNDIPENNLDFVLLETDRIFHLAQIRKICIDYRLRFLPSNYFKGGIPEEAISEVRQIEDAHATKIAGFHIVAPTKTFQLKDYNDPLLFAPIGNGYFYLVHKWGNDLNPWRKVLVWPFRNLLAFTLVTIALSLLIAWMTPQNDLSRNVPMASTIIFLFAFKSVFAVGLYGFFMLGKKFNCSIWDSVYHNN